MRDQEPAQHETSEAYALHDLVTARLLDDDEWHEFVVRLHDTATTTTKDSAMTNTLFDDAIEEARETLATGARVDQTTVTSLLHGIADMEAENARLRGRLDESDALVVRIEGERDEQRDAVRFLEENIEELRDHRGHIQARLTELEARLGTMENRAHELERKLSGFSEQFRAGARTAVNFILGPEAGE